jgi:hypothetical protein
MSDLKIMFMFTMSDKGPNFLCDRRTLTHSFVRTRLRGPKFSDRHAKSIDALRASIIIGYASDYFLKQTSRARSRARTFMIDDCDK